MKRIDRWILVWAAAGGLLQAAAAPMTRIAVARMGASSAVAAQFPGWDLGGGGAAQLAAALTNSGRFIVLERALADEVFWEQELGVKKLASPQTAPGPGRMIAAQFLVAGVITEFSQGGRKGIRLGFGGLGGGFDSVTSKVGFDLRLIDTATGRIVQAVHAEGKACGRGVSFNMETRRRLSAGGDLFRETALGRATQQAIERAVERLAAEPLADR